MSERFNRCRSLIFLAVLTRPLCIIFVYNKERKDTRLLNVVVGRAFVKCNKRETGESR